MNPEIKPGYSNEVPKGACVVGKETSRGKFETLAASDSASTDLLVDGVVRRELKKGEDVIIIILFNSEEEMEENLEHIVNAFGDLIDDD